MDPDHSGVPGVVLAHSPGATGVYIGSPSLVVLENGTYLASHDFFGPGTNFDRGAPMTVPASPTTAVAT